MKKSSQEKRTGGKPSHRQVREASGVSQKSHHKDVLWASDEQVKQLIDTSPIAMIVASGIEERVEWVNDKFIELFGYTIEDMPEVAFCARAILKPDNVLVVNDALKDKRFKHNPLVTSDPKIRSFPHAHDVTYNSFIFLPPNTHADHSNNKLLAHPSILDGKGSEDGCIIYQITRI